MAKPLTTATLRLATEKAEIKAEMARTLAAMKQTCVAAAKQAEGDLEKKTKAHPFITLGAAVATGFVAASVVVPRKKHPVSRLAALKQAITGRAEPEVPKHTLSHTAMKAAINLLKPALFNVVANLLTPKAETAEQNGTSEQNGNPGPARNSGDDSLANAHGNDAIDLTED